MIFLVSSYADCTMVFTVGARQDTIHAYCLRLLQGLVPEFGNFDVLKENRLAGLLSREPLEDITRSAGAIADTPQRGTDERPSAC